MYELIKSAPLKFPNRIILSDNAKDIIKKLLNRNVKKRLGNNGIKEIKEHPFFKDIDFNLIEQKKIPAPFVPKLNEKTDVQYFDEEFTNEQVETSFIAENNLDMIKANQDKFKDF
jgi:serine/threonine protein kinase